MPNIETGPFQIRKILAKYLVKKYIGTEDVNNMSKKEKKKYFKPGEKAEVSGQYKNAKTKKEVTVTSGEPLPPTPKKGQKYILVDPTNHKRQDTIIYKVISLKNARKEL